MKRRLRDWLFGAGMLAFGLLDLVVNVVYRRMKRDR